MKTIIDIFEVILEHYEYTVSFTAHVTHWPVNEYEDDGPEYDLNIDHVFIHGFELMVRHRDKFKLMFEDEIQDRIAEHMKGLVYETH